MFLDHHANVKAVYTVSCHRIDQRSDVLYQMRALLIGITNFRFLAP